MVDSKATRKEKKELQKKVFADFWLTIGSIIRAACKFVTLKTQKWSSAHINPQPYELKKFQVFSLKEIPDFFFQIDCSRVCMVFFLIFYYRSFSLFSMIKL